MLRFFFQVNISYLYDGIFCIVYFDDIHTHFVLKKKYTSGVLIRHNCDWVWLLSKNNEDVHVKVVVNATKLRQLWATYVEPLFRGFGVTVFTPNDPCGIWGVLCLMECLRGCTFYVHILCRSWQGGQNHRGRVGVINFRTPCPGPDPGSHFFKIPGPGPRPGLDYSKYWGWAGTGPGLT